MFEVLRNILKSFLPHAPATHEEKMAAVSKIESIISKAGTVSVFSKSYCPYCSRAKGILSSYAGLKPRMQIFELDEMGQEGSVIQEALAQKLGKSRVTVPQIFIGNKHIGGCDDVTVAQSNGTLDTLIEELKKTELSK